MGNVNGRPFHEKLLIGSYIFGLISSALAAAAALGATVARNQLEYPPVTGPAPTPQPANSKSNEPGKRYFEL